MKRPGNTMQNKNNNLGGDPLKAVVVPGKFLNLLHHCEEENTINITVCSVDAALPSCSIFTDLPMDAITSILSYLALEDMVRCRRLCKYWMQAIAHSDHICFDLDRHAEQKLRFVASQFDTLTSVTIRRHYAEDINRHLMRRFILHFSKNIASFSFTGRFCNVRTALRTLSAAERLQRLKLESCILDDVHSLCDILENKQHIRVLDLSYTRFFGSGGFESRYPFQHDCQVLSAYIGQLHNLEELNLSGGWNLADFDLKMMLSDLKYLRKLDVHRYDKASLVAATKYCPGLSVEHLWDE